MPKANEKQHGGDHYKIEGEQHWDRVYRLYGRGYFVGNGTKYLERYHLKNGEEDLNKAIHYIEKLKELEYPVNPTRLNINEFVPGGLQRAIHDCSHTPDCICRDCYEAAHKQ